MFVSYYASAELGCHVALDWQMPEHVVDLCAEFKLHTCELPVPNGRNLLGALAYYGLPALDAVLEGAGMGENAPGPMERNRRLRGRIRIYALHPEQADEGKRTGTESEAEAGAGRKKKKGAGGARE